jgi:putative addiction module component (TIGR02574 family)
MLPPAPQARILLLTEVLIGSIIRLMNLASIQSEIEKLEPAERAALIDVLWESLDEKRVKEIEAKWAAESEDRIDAFDRGELPAVDGPTALEELRKSLTK